MFFPFLRTKLNYNPPKDDGSTYKIELEGISVMVMREILDYIFSGQVWWDTEEGGLSRGSSSSGWGSPSSTLWLSNTAISIFCHCVLDLGLLLDMAPKGVLPGLCPWRKSRLSKILPKSQVLFLPSWAPPSSLRHEEHGMLHSLLSFCFLNLHSSLALYPHYRGTRSVSTAWTWEPPWAVGIIL